MTKTTIFFFLALSILGCAKHRPVPLDIQCDNNIKKASSLLKKTGEQLDPDTAKTITNLIQAAKIQQQHADFALCIDKAERALTLLKAKEQK